MAWYLKQLLPFTYRTKCEMEGKNYFVVWKMWLGHCYDEEWVEIAC